MKEADERGYVLGSIDTHRCDMYLLVDVERKSQNEDRFSQLNLVGGNKRSSRRKDLQVFAPIDVTYVWKQLFIGGADPLFALDAELRAESRVHKNVSPVGVLDPDARGQVAHHE